MSISYLRGATRGALMVALVFGAGAMVQAQDKENPEKGVVQIGRADKSDAKPNVPGKEEDQERPAPPKYWIGLLGGAIPAEHPLRAQLDLPEHQGLLVANVMPDGPAAKAGLKKNDILLKANNNDLHEMKDLVELVMSEGAKKGQITLEVLRHNKRETIYLKPEERPANAQMPEGVIGGLEGGPGIGQPGFPGLPDELMQQFRSLGPGVIVGGGGDAIGSMPNGVSVSIQKQNGQPTHITVTRGKEKWEVTGDDPDSLKKLPEDLRPFVERMLHGGGSAIHMPNFGPEGTPRFGRDMDNGALRERLERMEKRLEEMQKRLSGDNKSTTDKPKDQNNQAK